MTDYWLVFRFKLGAWMLRKSMDIMPRCGLRDVLRLAIVSAYSHEGREHDYY